MDGITLRIERGEVFGLLGPNGAGKTTVIKILNTLLYPTSGEALVAGHDVVRDAGEVRRRIALVSGGESSGYGILNVRECLWMFSQFYGVPRAEANSRVDQLIAAFGLGDLGDDPHQPAVHRPAPAHELRARVRVRPRDPVPRRAHARHGRQRRAHAARVRARVGARARRPHRAADHALHGRGRPDVRPHRHHRPRPRAGLRHAGDAAALGGRRAACGTRGAGRPRRPRRGGRRRGHLGRAAPRARHAHA